MDVFCHSIVPYLPLRDLYDARRTNVATYQQYQQLVDRLSNSKTGRAKILALALHKRDSYLLNLIVGNSYDEDPHKFFTILHDLVKEDLDSGSLDLTLAIASNVAWNQDSTYVDDYFGWRDLFAITLQNSPLLIKKAIERENLRYLWKRAHVQIFESTIDDHELLQQLFANLEVEDIVFNSQLFDVVLEK